MPPHRNDLFVILYSCFRAIPLVASVGQPKPQHSTLLTNRFGNCTTFFTWCIR